MATSAPRPSGASPSTNRQNLSRCPARLLAPTIPRFSHPAGKPARLAYSRYVADTYIWRMEVALDPGGHVRTVTDPGAVIASTRTDQQNQFSPDGRRIVFASDRDGFMEIWVSDSDGSNPSQLTNFKSPRCGTPRWSPDGRQIVFDSLVAGNNDIWVVGSEGGSPKRVTTEPSNDGRPSWSRDGRWIYFRSDRSGSQQIWRVPAEAPFQPAVQMTKNEAFEAVESTDGKLLYFINRGSLWSMPTAGGEETLVLASVEPGNWEPADAGVYYLDSKRASTDNSMPLVLFRLPSRKTIPIAVIPKLVTSNSQKISVTGDGRWITWTQLDHQDSDLLMIENFR